MHLTVANCRVDHAGGLWFIVRAGLCFDSNIPQASQSPDLSLFVLQELLPRALLHAVWSLGQHWLREILVSVHDMISIKIVIKLLEPLKQKDITVTRSVDLYFTCLCNLIFCSFIFIIVYESITLQ